jgi:hypothetical protein
MFSAISVLHGNGTPSGNDEGIVARIGRSVKAFAPSHKAAFLVRID